MGEIITDLARRGQRVDAAVLDGQVAQQGGLPCRRLADQSQKRRDGSLRRDSKGLQKRLLPILRKAQDSLLQRVNTIIMMCANGADPDVLYNILDGKPFGTRFIGRRAGGGKGEER